jgi:hypothetical protein
VPLHDQGGDCLLCRRFPEQFHRWFIPLGRASVKLVTLAAAALSGRASAELAASCPCLLKDTSHNVCYIQFRRGTFPLLLRSAAAESWPKSPLKPQDGGR